MASILSPPQCVKYDWYICFDSFTYVLCYSVFKTVKSLNIRSIRRTVSPKVCAWNYIKCFVRFTGLIYSIKVHNSLIGIRDNNIFVYTCSWQPHIASFPRCVCVEQSKLRVLKKIGQFGKKKISSSHPSALLKRSNKNVAIYLTTTEQDKKVHVPPSTVR